MPNENKTLHYIAYCFTCVHSSWTYLIRKNKNECMILLYKTPIDRKKIFNQ